MARQGLGASVGHGALEVPGAGPGPTADITVSTRYQWTPRRHPETLIRNRSRVAGHLRSITRSNAVPPSKTQDGSERCARGYQASFTRSGVFARSGHDALSVPYATVLAMSADDRSRERETLPRIGAPWTDADHAALVQGLRDGLTDEDLSTRLGRTVNGIRSRARLLLGPDHSKATGRAAIELLRQQVAEDATFDWQTNARESSKRAGRPYWSAVDDTALSDAWGKSMPLAQLADQFNASEQAVARQLIALGLASSTLEVTERLGCTPGGVVDMRRRLALDDEAAQLWVLVINGLPRQQSAHVSLHPTEAAAIDGRDSLLNENTIEARGNLWWLHQPPHRRRGKPRIPDTRLRDRLTPAISASSRRIGQAAHPLTRAIIPCDTDGHQGSGVI